MASFFLQHCHFIYGKTGRGIYLTWCLTSKKFIFHAFRNVKSMIPLSQNGKLIRWKQNFGKVILHLYKNIVVHLQWYGRIIYLQNLIMWGDGVSCSKVPSKLKRHNRCEGGSVSSYASSYFWALRVLKLTLFRFFSSRAVFACHWRWWSIMIWILPFCH